MKKEVIPYILIVVLVAVIAAGGTFIVMKGQLYNQNKEPNYKDGETENKDKNTKPNEEVQKSSIKLLETTKNNSNIIQTYDIEMNEKNISLKVDYKYVNDSNEYESVIGSMNGKEVYRKVNVLEGNISNSKRNEDFNEKTLNSNFSTNNFKFIKGTDNKDYLLVHASLENPIGGITDDLLIYNDNMELIKPNTLSMSCENDAMTIYTDTSSVDVKENPWYENQFNVSSNVSDIPKIQVKVENNQIYYLTPVFKNGDPDQGTLEERVYTINNNKLSYQTINTYKITSSAGGAC